MIIAGEASGDLHGAGLVRELKKMAPKTTIFGIGGDKMRSQGMQLVRHINEMRVLGFWDVLKQLRFFKKVYRELVDLLDTKKPDVLVLIDYPGLNLKLARAAKDREIPVFYYIAPQVWAWGAGRIKKMARTVTKMAVIIPFEEEMYRQQGVDAEFVGHPLLEVISTKLDKSDFFRQNNLNMANKTIGLLPGSRTLEVKRLLPTMAEAAHSLSEEFPDLQVLISQTASVPPAIYDEILKKYGKFHLQKDQTYEIMSYKRSGKNWVPLVHPEKPQN